MENTQARTTGSLYIVATPIGNLDDISQRAIKTLNSVDFILAEDTRHSKPFLQALGIFKPTIALHEHNEEKKITEIIKSLENGQSFALISDAGTPLISDPGFLLVRQAREQKLAVVPIPGPCALITALCASGLPTDNFCFGGFLPTKREKRKTMLEKACTSQQTYIFYESTHRLVESISDLKDIFGEDYIWVIAKELTKQFEAILYATSQEHLTWFAEDSLRTKGEFVFILPPKPSAEIAGTDEKRMLSILLQELPLSKAVKLASQLCGKSKNELYDLALSLTKI